MGDRIIRVLNVDDEVHIQLITKIALEASGFFVENCGTAEEALIKVVEFPADVILLDVMMPDMDGPALLKALRKIPKAAAIPVIFLTAMDQPHEAEHLKSIGALDVIKKPFDPMGLASKILEILEKVP